MYEFHHHDNFFTLFFRSFLHANLVKIIQKHGVLIDNQGTNWILMEKK